MAEAPPSAASPPATSLRDAMRGLRIAEAERTGVVVALRDAEFARLAMLHDRLKPVVAEVPAGIDLFDVGLTPGETPRLWIDMIAFVEMGRDKRSYRFLQDTRDGRRVLAEGPDAAAIADRVTAYIARRLIERERLMALPPVGVEPELPRAVLPRAEVPARLFAPDPAQETARAASPASAASIAASRPAETAAFSTADPAQAAPRAPSQADAAPRAETLSRQAEAESPPGTGDRSDARQPRVRFSGFGGFILFVLGVAAGAGGLLAVAQIAARL